MKIRKHFLYYLSLLLILTFGFLLATQVSDRQFQLSVAIITASFYVLWGIVHHHINHELNAKIVVEYTLIGALGIALIFFILKGGLGL